MFLVKARECDVIVSFGLFGSFIGDIKKVEFCVPHSMFSWALIMCRGKLLSLGGVKTKSFSMDTGKYRTSHRVSKNQ